MQIGAARGPFDDADPRVIEDRPRGVSRQDAGGDAARTRGSDVVRRVIGDDPTVLDEDDPVRELVRLLDVVGGEDNRAATVRVLVDALPEGPPGLRASTSMAAVGSSRIISSGFGMRAIPKRTRWISPPEHVEIFRSASSLMLARAMHLSTSASRNRPPTMCIRSRTVRSGSMPPDCMTAETSPAWAAVIGSSPKMRALPESGPSSPRARSIVVDFPAPLGPRKATTSPRSMVNETSSTAVMVPPLGARNVFVRDSRRIAAFGSCSRDVNGSFRYWAMRILSVRRGAGNPCSAIDPVTPGTVLAREHGRLMRSRGTCVPVDVTDVMTARHARLFSGTARQVHRALPDHCAEGSTSRHAWAGPGRRRDR